MNLDIVGLMCLPPQFDKPQKYFKKMIDLKNEKQGQSYYYEMQLSYKDNYHIQILNELQILDVSICLIYQM